jgi:hypothetical protein
MAFLIFSGKRIRRGKQGQSGRTERPRPGKPDNDICIGVGACLLAQQGVHASTAIEPHLYAEIGKLGVQVNDIGAIHAGPWGRRHAAAGMRRLMI